MATASDPLPTEPNAGQVARMEIELDTNQILLMDKYRTIKSLQKEVALWGVEIKQGKRVDWRFGVAGEKLD